MACAKASIAAGSPVKKCQPDSVAGTVILLEIGGFLAAGELGRFGGVDAEGDHVEVFTGGERQRLQAAGEPVQ